MTQQNNAMQIVALLLLWKLLRRWTMLRWPRSSHCSFLPEITTGITSYYFLISTPITWCIRQDSTSSSAWNHKPSLISEPLKISPFSMHTTQYYSVTLSCLCWRYEDGVVLLFGFWALATTLQWSLEARRQWWSNPENNLPTTITSNCIIGESYSH